MANKDSIDPVVENDLVLIYLEEQPVFFARVEGFTPDHKPNWWQVKLLILQVPVKVITWILRREQINGEPFTMNGTPIRIEKVVAPAEKDERTGIPKEQHKSDMQPASSMESKSYSKRPARILSLGVNRTGRE